MFILHRFSVIETTAEQKIRIFIRDNYAINHKRDNIIREDGYFAFPSLIFII